MRALSVVAALSLIVPVAVARAEPKLPPGTPPLTARPHLDGLQDAPPLHPRSNCGDPVPYRIEHVPAPRPPGDPGAGLSFYFTPGFIHFTLKAIVKNVGTQPSGGAAPFQFVTVSRRLLGASEEVELLRSNFGPLRAGESRSYPFELRLPYESSSGRIMVPSATLTMSLTYLKDAPATPRPADCVMTDNVLVIHLRFFPGSSM